MKSLFFLFLFTSLTTLVAQETYDLTVSFDGIKSDSGNIYIGLHNKKETFLKERFKEACVKITDKKASFTFKKLPKGEYAVSAFHDENENKKMDTNFLGIPKEPIGVSNDAKGFMGPPKYDAAKLLITKNTTTIIKLN